MSQENLFHLNISEADLQLVHEALEGLRRVLGPHLATLSVGVRRELPKMGDRTQSFVRKANEYCHQNEKLVPYFLSVELFDNDLKATETLLSIQRKLKVIAQGVDDSVLLAGSEAYQAALVFYRNIKVASQSDQPGAKAIQDDLSARFPGGKRAAAIPSPQ